MDEERHVDADDDDEEEEEELHVVPQVDPRDVVRQRLREALRPGLGLRGLRRHQPLSDAERKCSLNRKVFDERSENYYTRARVYNAILV